MAATQKTEPVAVMADEVNYASHLHPDVQRGTAIISDSKPIIDVSSLVSVPPFTSQNSTASFVRTSETIAEENEESEDEESEEEHSKKAEKKPFVVNGSGDPAQNKYPHPSLAQLQHTDQQGSSEVLTASLIEIRKHPSTYPIAQHPADRSTRAPRPCSESGSVRRLLARPFSLCTLSLFGPL